MEDFCLLILRLIHLVYQADERPEARRFTIGCGVVLLFALGLFVLLLTCL